MKQYWDIKNQHSDKILLFRMGDFYEMFHEDAIVSAPLLNIALTARNKKAQDETPMCGVPHHSIAGPIAKLLQAGHKVALCEQLEDPSEAQGLVKRGVTRVLSPGMVYDPQTLNELNAHYIASFDQNSVAFLESTTGEAFYYLAGSSQAAEALRDQLFQLLNPVELVVSSEQKNQLYKTASLGTLFVNREAIHLSIQDELIKREPTWSAWPTSALRLLAYVYKMQGESAQAVLKPFEERQLTRIMNLSATAIRHLEIFKNNRGEEKGSLFSTLNRTKTSAGARLFKSWLMFPHIDKPTILARQEAVQEWFDNVAGLKALRQSLQGLGDIERRLSKISFSNAQVHDVVALLQSLKTGLTLCGYCKKINVEAQSSVEKVVQRIEKTLVEDPPLHLKEGGVIRKDYSPELAQWVEKSENGQSLLIQFEAQEKARTGISSLKVKYNNIFGYSIEITNAHKEKVPDHYKRKQTLANAERYVTQELHDLETELLQARSKRIAFEEQIFNELKKFIMSQAPLLKEAASAWAELDVISSLAWLALEQNYVRPTFNEDGLLELIHCRHPVIEAELSTEFYPNSIHLKNGECLLLTGPNMAGKSTLMRQVALIALMSQVGSFVPAQRASLPLFEKIFTRIGASDFLTEGLSTFMVEMKETAEMLAEVNEKSLVILDEIGRGTSTYDGLSLAQGILEHLVEKKRPYLFFATHYHELTVLAKKFKNIKNGHMAIEDKTEEKSAEKKNQLRFLYRLKPGAANKSYGLHVAALAGLPQEVVQRAQVILKDLESEGRDKYPTNLENLPLFSLSENSVVEKTDTFYDSFLAEIKNIQLSQMTPLEALNKLNEWQQKLLSTAKDWNH